MRTLLNITGILLLFFLTASFNIGLIDLRLDQINLLLGKIATHEDIAQTTAVVGKYHLIKQRIEMGEGNTSSYDIEAKVLALTSGDYSGETVKPFRKKIYREPVRFMVNVIRLMLGKDFIRFEEGDKLFKVLEIGYFWERNRKYTEAINIYDQILDKYQNVPELRSSILLHKAFCHSMLGEYEKAKVLYERIINLYPNTEAGILSWQLLDFIEELEKKRISLKTQELSDFEKAKQFYMLMDYRNAIKYLSIFLQSGASTPLYAEARYYKGRAHEELGETEEAISDYNEVIRGDKTKVWAKQANRRMLMLGEFYEQKKQMAEEARRQLALYKDSSFIKSVNDYSQLISTASLRSELLAGLAKEKEKKTKKNQISNDSLMALINKIGELDLTGEKQKKQELQKLKEQLISQGQLTSVEVQHLEKQVALAENPFRRPTAIKQIIDNNSNQLRYLYNKRLRDGMKISGKILVEIKIAPSGKISQAAILSSNLGDSKFEEDILEKISSWQFNPVPEELGELTVKYPFEFYQE